MTLTDREAAVKDALEARKASTLKELHKIEEGLAQIVETVVETVVEKVKPTKPPAKPEVKPEAKAEPKADKKS